MAERTSSSRQAVLVLGMHRSGTSALGGVLARLGLEAPASLIPAARDNPRGFWESKAIVDFHDRLLASLDSSWLDWKAIEPSRLQAGEAAGLIASMPELIDQEFGDAGMFFVKDPRTCRFPDAWTQALGRRRIQAKAIIPFRHPMEVASSLGLRNKMGRTSACLLWLRHALDAEAQTRDLPRAFLAYPSLLGDWRLEMGRVSEALGIDWPVTPRQASSEVDEFLSGELRHFSLDALDGDIPPLLSAWLQEVLDLMQRLAATPSAPVLARLDEIRAEFDAATDCFGGALREVEEARSAEIARLHRRIADKHVTGQRSGVPESSAVAVPLDQASLARDLQVAVATKLVEMESRLKGRDAINRSEIAGLKKLLKEADATTAATAFLVTELESGVGQIKELRASLSARDKEMQALQRRFDQSLGLHREEGNRRRAVNAELRGVIARQEEILDSLAGEVRDRQSDVSRLQGELDAAHATNVRKLDMLEREIKARQAITDSLATELERLRGSKAVRLASMLRLLTPERRRAPDKEHEPDDAAVIESSGLFDREWYLARYPDVARRKMDPIQHYLRHGARELRSPSVAFDTRAYLARHPDVEKAGINPLVHYIRHGLREGRIARETGSP